MAAGIHAHTAAASGGVWDFVALLNGEPIGEHRFSVVASGDGRKVASDANFTVKFVGITAYRYRHHAIEQWRGNCLKALDATTDDDGKATQVDSRTQDERLIVSTNAGNARTMPDCVMSFAYWNPAIRTQARLLNAQSGELEEVQIRRIGTGDISVRGTTMTATRWRISGPPRPIDVWYSAQDEWVGLDSTVAGGRTLSYRLK
ncbi:DUF6134 family protein [Variovorax sp. J22R133]|uniref:DUF6134 family protein n=1 Tax=Variovorax brevis TaxID=3053503 RepID=UPI0025775824|nr:DUF6134 family protein [Variovorax sp. J22R133]MDM0111144.1 DUF6134 family protein [Variovorax sp. J22R133]